MRTQNGPNCIGSQIGHNHPYEPVLYPLLSTEVLRYKRRISIPQRDKSAEIVIQPLTLRFNHAPLKSGWVRCVHPEGALYYYNKDKRVYTEAQLDDPFVVEKIEACIGALFKSHEIAGDQQGMIEESDLVLELWAENDCLCGYYFAHHESRTLFWLDEQNMQYDLQEVHGELTQSHMKHAMDRFYWQHMSLFPYGHPASLGLVAEVKAVLVWTLTDELTSLTSPSQYDAVKLRQLISVVDDVKDMIHDDSAMATLARILAEFAWSRFLNYHGEHGARLNSDQSVHNHDPTHRSYVMSFVFLLLFNSPIAHFNQINDVYVDGIIKAVTWQNHVDRLHNDWQKSIIYSGILLLIDTLLTLSNLVSNSTGSRIASQVACYLSMLTSIGSIVIGLLLQRQHQSNPRMDASDAVKYMMKCIKRAGSVEMLAISYGVPYALFIWSIIGFLAAITAQCVNTSNTVIIIIYSVALGLLVGLTLWSLYLGSHSDQVTKGFDVLTLCYGKIRGIAMRQKKAAAEDAHELPRHTENDPEK